MLNHFLVLDKQDGGENQLKHTGSLSMPWHMVKVPLCRWGLVRFLDLRADTICLWTNEGK